MDKNLKTALIIGGIVLVILVVLPQVLGWQGYGYGMMGPGMMGGSGTMWLMPVFWILILGLVIWAVVALVRGLGGGEPSDLPPSDSSLEILKRRYARGEISKEEYEEKKKDLV